MRAPRSTWPPGPPAPGLDPGHVHVWAAALDQPAAVVSALCGVLSPDEDARARALRRPRDAARFRMARAFVRRVAARYVGVAPDRLRLALGPAGKPHLVPIGSEPPLRFNLSHSRGLALLGVSRDLELGVDVEHVRDVPLASLIARRYFHERETDAVDACRRGAAWAFLRIWTRKEALVKVTGEGVAAGLRAFHVSGPAERARVQRVRRAAVAGEAWTLRDIAPSPGFLAALAVGGEPIRVARWTWPPGDAGDRA